ncbi:MAG: DUF302 domain-containing protein [Oligoflexales bacterium]
MTKKILFLVFSFGLSNIASANVGFKSLKSKLTVENAYKKVEEKINSLGFTVFAKIDHQANAKKAGLNLPPNIVIIFGKAKAGTKLMLESPEVGFDLPLKIQIYKSEKGSAINYPDVSLFKKKYQIKKETMILSKIEGVLSKIATYASK